MVLDRGKFLSTTRISERLVAAGVSTTKLPETLRFYGEILGFAPKPTTAATSPADQRLQLRVGANGDYVEVHVAAKDDTPFFRFEVRDLDHAKAQLERSLYFPTYGRPVVIETGSSRRRLIALRDPEGIRVELVEPDLASSKAGSIPYAPPSRVP